MTTEQEEALAALLATHADTLRQLLPTHLWPVTPFKVEQFGNLAKYTLGQLEDGRWAMLHHLRGIDAGPAGPHDHQMDMASIGIKGSYWERVYCPDGHTEIILRAAGGNHTIWATTVHEVFALPEGDCWTLVAAGVLIKGWRHYPELV